MGTFHLLLSFAWCHNTGNKEKNIRWYFKKLNVLNTNCCSPCNLLLCQVKRWWKCILKHETQVLYIYRNCKWIQRRSTERKCQSFLLSKIPLWADTYRLGIVYNSEFRFSEDSSRPRAARGGLSLKGWMRGGTSWLDYFSFLIRLQPALSCGFQVFVHIIRGVNMSVSHIY